MKDLAGEKKGCTTVEKGNGGIQEEEVCELEKGCRIVRKEVLVCWCVLVCAAGYTP